MDDRQYFDGSRWYQKEIKKRTKKALLDRNAAFCREHANASDAELLQFLIDRIHVLGYVPHAAEVIGAPLIIARFGTWEQAIRAAGYRFPKGSSKLQNTRLYKEEEKNQIRLYRIERQARLEKKAARKELHEEQYKSKEKAGSRKV